MTWVRCPRIPEASAVRSLHFLLEGEVKKFYESFAARGTLSATRSRDFTWPHIVHALLDRYLPDSELQKAHDRVTLVSQKLAEDENAYADRIMASSHDCSNVFEDHTLVHYYVRGLLEKTSTNSSKTCLDYRNTSSATSYRSAYSLLRKATPYGRNPRRRPKHEHLRTDELRQCTSSKNSNQICTSVTPTSRISSTIKREFYPTPDFATPR